MWIILWVVLSVFVLGVFAWSQRILVQQKRAWAAFAKKNGFLYEPGKFMAAPAMAGKTGPYVVAFYTDAQQTGDARGQRLVSVLEIELGRGIPGAGAIGTKEMAGFIGGLKFKESFEPDFPDWKKEWVLRAREAAAVNAYLTKERLDALRDLFSMKAASMFFFDELASLIRIETVDPLKDPERLEKILKRLVPIADRLAPSESEKARAGAPPDAQKTAEI